MFAIGYCVRLIYLSVLVCVRACVRACVCVSVSVSVSVRIVTAVSCPTLDFNGTIVCVDGER